MDRVNIVQIAAIVSVFVSVLLAVFLFSVKTRNRLSNALFAWFLLWSALDISGWFIFPLFRNYLDLEMLRGQTSWFIMPSFYLYILSVCYSDFRLKAKHLWHATWFIAGNLLVTPRFYLANVAGKTLYFENFRMMPESIIQRVFTDIQFAFYIIAALLVLKRYNKIYQENYTDSSTMTYKWLFQLIVLSVGAHCIVMIKQSFLFTGYDNLFIWSTVVVSIIALSIICWIVLKALNYPELFRGVDSKLKPVEKLVAENQAESLYVRDGVTRETEEKIGQLKKYMNEEQPYLEPSLTIQDLAHQFGMPVKDLSILINHQLDQHFFDFVNEYRIEKAMSLLKDPGKSKLTILEILYEVGFNSKSSFNTAFKKHTGLTPTAYRNAVHYKVVA